ncbi:hypothetical protein ACA910_008199 [Epithemia clementina (nom. ined.)]
MDVENDAEIERLGSTAAGEFMAAHESLLDALAWTTRPAAETIVWTLNTATDELLYRTLLSNNLQHFLAPTIDDALILKTERWRNLLLCMNGRIEDYDFITLLCPSIYESYEEQRANLLVVPRAQFVLVEICRCRQGWYDSDDWRGSRRLCVARRQCRLLPTPLYSVIEPVPKQDQTNDAVSKTEAFDQELKRQLQLSEGNRVAARRGYQLEHCLPAQEAAQRFPVSAEVAHKLESAVDQLYNGDKRYVVLDDVVSQNICEKAYKAGLSWFGRKDTSIDTGFISAQNEHRQDQIVFVPIFDFDPHALAKALKEPAGILANVASSALSTTTFDESGDNMALPLLVPNLAQLALYDGVSSQAPEYVVHSDNCREIGGDGENYRELTAILYLNSPPLQNGGPTSAGGSLRCFDDPDGDENSSYVDIEPSAGRLVIFQSRDLMHSVLPVIGWRRLALSVWILKDSRSLISVE